jgi:hypothetical protein
MRTYRQIDFDVRDDEATMKMMPDETWEAAA